MGELRAGKYASVYVLQGEETYYIDLIANYIETHAIPESEQGFNQVVLYGRDVVVSGILSHARRFPMMAERQLVVVREAQEIQDIDRQEGAKLLLDYLKRPTPSTILVLCYKHKHLDKRKELGKVVDTLAVSAVFKRAGENQLPDFVRAYVQERAFAIDEEAARLLCEHVGNDLKRLASEIDKLLIVTEKSTSITTDKVIAQVGISREYNVFELQKALIRKDALQAHKIARYFESHTKRAPLIPMVAFLYSFFSKLLVAAGAIDKSERALIGLLKINPYAVRDYSSALRNYTTRDIARCIQAIAEADLHLKGVNAVSVDEGQILKELIYRLIT